MFQSNECKRYCEFCTDIGGLFDNLSASLTIMPPFTCFLSLCISDIRRGNCYNKFESGLCLEPRVSNMTKAQCCCSQGAAWGSNPCEVCPTPQEGGFAVLCPDGYGYVKETVGETMKGQSALDSHRMDYQHF